MFKVVPMRLRFIQLALCLVAIGCGGVSWGISFELPELTLPMNTEGATTGAFDVLVRATPEELPQLVAGVNVAFQSVESGLFLGPASQPTVNALFSGEDFREFLLNDSSMISIGDFGESDQQLADGLSLVHVEFAVPAGVTGDFGLSFIQSSDFNLLLDPSAEPLPLDLSGTGMISIVEETVGLQGDYNMDGRVNIADYTVWRDTLGSTTDLRANGDNTGASQGIVDASDYATWKGNFGMTNIEPLPGDYNADGAVNIADYTVWRDSLGSTSDLRANGDDTGASMGLIDASDYQFWKSNFGQSQLAASALTVGVPEPAPITLLLLCIGIGYSVYSTKRTAMATNRENPFFLE